MGSNVSFASLDATCVDTDSHQHTYVTCTIVFESNLAEIHHLSLVVTCESIQVRADRGHVPISGIQKLTYGCQNWNEQRLECPTICMIDVTRGVVRPGAARRPMEARVARPLRIGS